MMILSPCKIWRCAETASASEQILHATRMLMLPRGNFGRQFGAGFTPALQDRPLWKVFVRDTYPLRKRLGIRREPLGRAPGDGPKA